MGQNIAQRTETGGTATFQSEGDVVLSSGATVNVSGGATTYQGGTIQTSYLMGANGQLYNIGTANPLLTYKGVVNPTFTQTFDKWGIQEVIPTPGLSQYESTYVQGASAGSIQIRGAQSVARRQSRRDRRERSLSAQRAAPRRHAHHRRADDWASFRTQQPADRLSGAERESSRSRSPPIVVADGSPLPAQTLQLPVSFLTVGRIHEHPDLQQHQHRAARGPAAAAHAGRIALAGGAAHRRGLQHLESRRNPPVRERAHLGEPGILVVPGPGSLRPGIGIGDGVTLDVSGQWTNDATLAGGVGTAPTYLNGGKIGLLLTTPGSELVLGDDVSLKANGGAWLQSGGTVSYGSGGAITLDASPSQAAIQFGQDTLVQGFGTGTALGGTFTLSATRLNVSEGTSASWTEAQTVDDLSNPAGPVLDSLAVVSVPALCDCVIGSRLHAGDRGHGDAHARFRHPRHDLRHFFATTCIESGVDIPTVSRWLGHKDGGALAMRLYGHGPHV